MNLKTSNVKISKVCFLFFIKINTNKFSKVKISKVYLLIFIKIDTSKLILVFSSFIPGWKLLLERQLFLAPRITQVIICCSKMVHVIYTVVRFNYFHDTKKTWHWIVFPKSSEKQMEHCMKLLHVKPFFQENQLL